MRITVVGTGYVGLVTGVCFASIGHEIACVDIDENKIGMLQNGKTPIFEPGLDELMLEYKEKITYSADCAGAYKNADVIFIGVGTPEKSDGSANLTQVFDVAKQIAQNVQKDCLVVIKSTVPIGTNEKVEAHIKQHLGNNVKVEVASNPEFLAQGTAIKDTLHAKRIVLGVESDSAKKTLKSVYDAFNLPYVITDRKSAEMIKYASNDFLALKISYINEIANICDVLGANVDDVAKGMGLDPRIGDKFLQAGIGYGGSCFPKDTKALHWLASFHDYEIKTVKAAIEVNENQKIRLIKKANKIYSSFANRNIAVLGLTFKPGTDDLREAPALNNIKILLEDGANICVWDAAGMDNFKKQHPDLKVKYCTSIEETIDNAEICFIFTEWPQVVDFKLKKYKQLMKTAVIFDGRNCYSISEVKAENITYYSIGRPANIEQRSNIS